MRVQKGLRLRIFGVCGVRGSGLWALGEFRVFVLWASGVLGFFLGAFECSDSGLWGLWGFRV